MDFYPNWIYASSSCCDFTQRRETENYFKRHRPDVVLHLASKVGGVKYNIENPAYIYQSNTLINTNVLQSCAELGVKRVISALSTCAFPNVLPNYPFREEDIFEGAAPPTNLAYAESKRGLHTFSMALRDQFGYNYSTFCPSNLYGAHDHFSEEGSHFVAALISKIKNYKTGEKLTFWGTGKPLRQHLFVDDVCELIPKIIDTHNSSIPLIMAPSENLSIEDSLIEARAATGVEFEYEFDSSKPDGQFRKDGSNIKLLKMFPDFKFTPFKEGLKKTFNWYIRNK